MRVIGMITNNIAMGRLQPVDKPHSYQEFKVPIDRQRSNLSLLLLLKAGDELVGGNRPVTGQHFGIGGQSCRR